MKLYEAEIRDLSEVLAEMLQTGATTLFGSVACTAVISEGKTGQLVTVPWPIPDQNEFMRHIEARIQRPGVLHESKCSIALTIRLTDLKTETKVLEITLETNFVSLRMTRAQFDTIARAVYTAFNRGASIQYELPPSTERIQDTEVTTSPP